MKDIIIWSACIIINGYNALVLANSVHIEGWFFWTFDFLASAGIVISCANLGISIRQLEEKKRQETIDKFLS